MKKTLSRYKTVDSTPLELYFPMEFLQDEDFCEALRDDLKYCGDGWERVSNVSSSSSSLIPDCKGVYMFVWSPDTAIEINDEPIRFRYVVYVGSASNGSSSILKRFNSDYKSIINSEPAVHWTENMPSNRASRLKKALNLGRLEYWYVTMEGATSEQILDIEKRLINLFNPPGNTAFKTPIRVSIDSSKKAPAFEPAF